MKQYIDKATVKAEIERRKNQFVSQAEAFRKIGMENKESYYAALASNMNSLSCFIDSLDDKCDGCNNVKGCINCEDGSEWAHYEDPVSGDLGEYINELSKQFPDVSFAKLSRIAVRVAKWGMEQAKVKIQAQSMALAHGCPKEPVSEELEEEIHRYYVDWDEHPQYVQTARHFAKWQKQQIIEKACEWLKEQDERVGVSFEEDFIERFKNYMERE